MCFFPSPAQPSSSSLGCVMALALASAEIASLWDVNDKNEIGVVICRFVLLQQIPNVRRAYNLYRA